MSKEDQVRYVAACHAMQSAVAAEIALAPDDAGVTPKTLRVGVNSALVNSSYLTRLLIEKGVITTDEFEKALADGMEEEVERYRQAFRARGLSVDFA